MSEQSNVRILTQSNPHIEQDGKPRKGKKRRREGAEAAKARPAATLVYGGSVPDGPKAGAGPDGAKRAGMRVLSSQAREAEQIRQTGDDKPRARARRRGGFRRRGALSPTDRLLRNSAVACAVLLGILALGNIHEPWAEKASESIEQALTMRIDLDESIGGLTFVREIMPESALVFLNLSGASAMTLPVDGHLTHPWSAAQPWLMFACDEGAPVYAAAAGTVTAVSPLSGGLYGVLIDHGSGVESVCSGLAAADIEAGDAVQRGQILGRASESVYYELREAGAVTDPTARLGL